MTPGVRYIEQNVWISMDIRIEESRPEAYKKLSEPLLNPGIRSGNPVDPFEAPDTLKDVREWKEETWNVPGGGVYWMNQLTSSGKVANPEGAWSYPRMWSPLPGENVTIYVMSTGIAVDHEDFLDKRPGLFPYLNLTRAMHFQQRHDTDRSPYCPGVPDEQAVMASFHFDHSTSRR